MVFCNKIRPDLISAVEFCIQWNAMEFGMGWGVTHAGTRLWLRDLSEVNPVVTLGVT